MIDGKDERKLCVNMKNGNTHTAASKLQYLLPRLMILPIPISIYDDVVNINKLKKRRKKEKQQNNTQILHQKQM